ncbi:MAG: S-layer homology domain-containing protein, partial [Oscillospiraceae bacterium]
ITISGGAVRAESYYGGGIGGGGDLSGGNTGGDGGTITISGGTVEVQSVSGAGIGGGNSGFGFSGFIQTKGTGGSGGTITISGGSVTATTMTGRSISLFSDMNEGRWAGAAIGGGSCGGGSGGTVTISGGTVEAVSTERVGIGSGGMPFYQSESPAVDQYFHCVSGKAGTFATGEDGNAMLIATGGTDHIEDDDDTSAWYGVIFLGSEGQIYGDKVTLSTDCTIPGGKQLTIGEGQSLLLDAGVTLTIDNENCITGAGTLGAGGSYQILNPLPVFTPTTLFYTGSDLSGRLSLTAPAGSVSIMGQTFTVSGTPTYRDWVITLPAGGILQVGTYTVTAYSPSQGRTVSGQITVIGDSSSTPTYSVILPGRVEGGTVTAKKSYAEEGETFRFTVTPDEGWELDTLSVTDNRGTELDVKYEGDSVYSFKMPARRVEIQVSFREIPPESLPFTDIADNAWYADAVRYVYKHGLMAGTSATTFAPDVTTSRSMIATILWRMAGSPVVNYAMTYTDVAQGQWYSEAVRWATSEGIVGGYGNGLFGTNDPITREQFAAMLYRFAQEQGYEVSIGENTNILSYTDVADLSEYAISAMQWAVGAGIINGTGDGSTLSPQGQATRAQAAVMLMRFCEEYVTW